MRGFNIMRILYEIGAPEEIMTFLTALAILGIGVVMFIRYKNIGKK